MSTRKVHVRTYIQTDRQTEIFFGERCGPSPKLKNQNSVQNQDQDQDHDITLDFNTRPTFHTPTKYCLDPLTPSKVIVSTWKVHVRTYIQTDRQTEIFFGLFCLLRHTNHEHLSKGEFFFFFTHAITILSLFTYSVCDETVKRHRWGKMKAASLMWRYELFSCRNTQAAYDKCVLDKLNVERPGFGYFCEVKIHDSKRPKPEGEKAVDYPDATPGLPEGNYPPPRFGGRGQWQS